MDDSHSTSTPALRVVDLKPDMRTAEVLQRIGKSCVDLLRLQEDEARRKPEGVHHPEGVHQMRITIRRLRTALLGFGNHLQGDQFRWVNRELRWISGILGVARDLDIFEANLRKDDIVDFAGTETRLLVDTIGELRNDAYEAVVWALRTPRYEALHHGLTYGFEQGNWARRGNDEKQEEAALTLQNVAPMILQFYYKKAQKAAKGFAHQSIKKRHDLRIRFKRLRYMSELIGVIYPGDQVRDFIRLLKTIQDDLGIANDIHSARDIVTAFRHDSTQLSSIGQRYLDIQQSRFDETKTQKHLSNFFHLKPFWSI